MCFSKILAANNSKKFFRLTNHVWTFAEILIEVINKKNMKTEILVSCKLMRFGVTDLIEWATSVLARELSNILLHRYYMVQLVNSIIKRCIAMPTYVKTSVHLLRWCKFWKRRKHPLQRQLIVRNKNRPPLYLYYERNSRDWHIGSLCMKLLTLIIPQKVVKQLSELVGKSHSTAIFSLTTICGITTFSDIVPWLVISLSPTYLDTNTIKSYQHYRRTEK